MRKLQIWNDEGGRRLPPGAPQALLEVVFFSLLVVAVSFIPIFTLVDQEGRLFKRWPTPRTWPWPSPRCWRSRWFRLRMMFTRMDPFMFRPRWLAKLVSGALVGTYHAEEKHPVSAMHRI